MVRHVLVALAVVVMVGLGLWQLQRLEDRRDRNALVTDRLDQPVADVDDVGDDDPDALRFRRVTATGRYRADEEVLVRNRSFDGQAGSWVLTPLELSDGRAVAVMRGWVPVTGGDPAPPEAAPPVGEVTVEGLIETSQQRGRFGPTDPTGTTLDTLSRVDLTRLAGQVDAPLLPYWVQLEASTPEPGGTLPAVVPREELSEGPHLGYAVQWFVFAAIAAGGYVLILRRASA